MHALLAGLSVYCLAIYYMKRREREVGLYAFQAAQPKLEAAAAAGITLFPSCLVHPKIETKKRKEKKEKKKKKDYKNSYLLAL